MKAHLDPQTSPANPGVSRSPNVASVQGPLAIDASGAGVRVTQTGLETERMLDTWRGSETPSLRRYQGTWELFFCSYSPSSHWRHFSNCALILRLEASSSTRVTSQDGGNDQNMPKPKTAKPGNPEPETHQVGLRILNTIPAPPDRGVQ